MRLMTRAGVYHPTCLFAQVLHCSGEQEHRGLGRTPVPPEPFFYSSSPLCKTSHLKSEKRNAVLGGISEVSLQRTWG